MPGEPPVPGSDDAQAQAASLKAGAEEALRAGRVEDARRAFSEALRLSPRDLEARDGVVRCTVALGDAALAARARDRAISHYQLALELSPFHPEADAGLRRAAQLPDDRAGSDALGSAFESLPPVRAVRDLQVVDRVVGKVAGTAPSRAIRDSIDERRAGLEAAGAPPRHLRIEHEMATAWRRRWLYRAAPAAIMGASVLLWVATGSALVLNWGILLGVFAAAWDLAFVERGRAAHRRLGQGPP
jgi:tetratricopeptide (TPR) repeat protein